MPHITTNDGTKLYVEEAGEGTPVIFVHEYAGDWRTWEPQMRFFSRMHRCVTYSQRGYPPSDVPTDPGRYGQDIARDDVVAVMDALGIDKVWYGILLTLSLEMALISPPVAMNLVVIKAITGAPLAEVNRSIMPYMLMLALGTGLLIAFPEIALWLPRQAGYQG